MEDVDGICVIILFEAMFVLVAAAIVFCSVLFDNFTVDVWELR